MVCKGRFALSCFVAYHDIVVVLFHSFFDCSVGTSNVDFTCDFAFSLVDYQFVSADVVISTFVFWAVPSTVAGPVDEVSGVNVTVDFVGEIVL